MHEITDLHNGERIAVGVSAVSQPSPRINVSLR